MNVHELPMITFTVLAQMSVGAFVALGVIQVVASRRYGKEAVDAVTDPALYAIGPVMVLGLMASTLHMTDITNTLNVFRHISSSWLSREIVFGAGFAGLGFAFAACQWFRLGSTRLRQALALLTAAVGLCLVWSMSMIYYSLVTVPAWNTWATPVQFFTTAFLLGSLAVGAALMGALRWRDRASSWLRSEGRVATRLQRVVEWRGRIVARSSAGRAEAAGPSEAATRALLTGTLKGVGVTAMVLLGVQFITIPLHIANLNAIGGVASVSAEVYSGAWFIARLVLVFAGAGLLMVFLFRYATSGAAARTITAIATAAFVLALAGEFIGRSLFYDSMLRIGM